MFASASMPFPRLTSVIRCPTCGHAQEAAMPTDSCQIVYTCPTCQSVLRPQPGDCCVFCSYGSVPCPSIQQEALARDVAAGNGTALDRLKAWFNEHAHAPRLVAPLSPTCPECLSGAEAVRHVITATPALQASILWIPMLPNDTPLTSAQAAATFTHPRIQMEHDPHQQAGTYLAKRLGGTDWIAWDCYLLYPPGVVWQDELPQPDQWYHQLESVPVAPERQRCGAALLPALLAGVQHLAR